MSVCSRKLFQSTCQSIIIFTDGGYSHGFQVLRASFRVLLRAGCRFSRIFTESGSTTEDPFDQSAGGVAFLCAVDAFFAGDDEAYHAGNEKKQGAFQAEQL